MSIVFFSDSHLQKGAWAGRSVRGDAKFSLQQIVDFAIENRVEGVVGAGDLIDQKLNRAEPIACFMLQLDRLREAGVPFWYVQGQHEKDDPPWLSAHPWAQHLDKKAVDFGGTVVYGLDFRFREELQEALLQIPTGVDVLVCHQVWQEFMDLSPQASFEDLPEHVTQMVTGDYHQSICQTFERVGKPPITVVSPGSTCLQEIAEPEEKFFYVLGEFHGKPSWAEMPLKTRATLRWPLLKTADELDHFVAKVRPAIETAKKDAAAAGFPEELLTPIVHVRYGPAVAEKARAIETAVGARAHLFVTPPKALRMETGALDLPEQEATVEAVYRERLEDCPEALELMEALWEDPSPKDAFAAWREKHLV